MKLPDSTRRFLFFRGTRAIRAVLFAASLACISCGHTVLRTLTADSYTVRAAHNGQSSAELAGELTGVLADSCRAPIDTTLEVIIIDYLPPKEVYFFAGPDTAGVQVRTTNARLKLLLKLRKRDNSLKAIYSVDAEAASVRELAEICRDKINGVLSRYLA
jgi:hypothetical protein